MIVKGKKRQYSVIAVWENGKRIAPKSFPQDEIAAISAANLKAERSNPTWDLFGGVLNIGSRSYQVS